jgi:hypothetical protein
MAAHVTTLQTAAMEGRYRLLVDAITDYAIYMLDTDGHVSSWNTGTPLLKGYTESDPRGALFPLLRAGGAGCGATCKSACNGSGRRSFRGQGMARPQRSCSVSRIETET